MLTKLKFLCFGNNKESIRKWSSELNYGKVKEDIKHLGITICNNNDETVFKTCIDIESRMQTALEYFVKTRVDLFKEKLLLKWPFTQNSNIFFNLAHCPNDR